MSKLLIKELNNVLSVTRLVRARVSDPKLPVCKPIAFNQCEGPKNNTPELLCFACWYLELKEAWKPAKDLSDLLSSCSQPSFSSKACRRNQNSSSLRWITENKLLSWKQVVRPRKVTLSLFLSPWRPLFKSPGPYLRGRNVAKRLKRIRKKGQQALLAFPLHSYSHWIRFFSLITLLCGDPFFIELRHKIRQLFLGLWISISKAPGSH